MFIIFSACLHERVIVVILFVGLSVGLSVCLFCLLTVDLQSSCITMVETGMNTKMKMIKSLVPLFRISVLFSRKSKKLPFEPHPLI